VSICQVIWESFQIGRLGRVEDSYQLSAISYQLSAISYQLSAISYQLSAISYQLSAISYHQLQKGRSHPLGCQGISQRFQISPLRCADG
jgi:hypothetical protein